MSASWDEIYEGYSGEELTAERVRIKKLLDIPYRGQTTGRKSYEKDLAHLTARLQSLTRIMRERGLGRGAPSRGGDAYKGQVDLSGPGLDEF